MVTTNTVHSYSTGTKDLEQRCQLYISNYITGVLFDQVKHPSGIQRVQTDHITTVQTNIDEGM